jgi:hypothetical protein
MLCIRSDHVIGTKNRSCNSGQTGIRQASCDHFVINLHSTEACLTETRCGELNCCERAA